MNFELNFDLTEFLFLQFFQVHFLSKMKYGKINSNLNGYVKKGVMYATYSALIGESQSGGKYKTRLTQLVHWCGADFDGAIGKFLQKNEF